MQHKKRGYQTLKGWVAVIREGRKQEQKVEDGQDSASDHEDQDTDDAGWLTEEDDDRRLSGRREKGSEGDPSSSSEEVQWNVQEATHSDLSSNEDD